MLNRRSACSYFFAHALVIYYYHSLQVRDQRADDIALYQWKPTLMQVSDESPEFYNYMTKANMVRGDVINCTILLERVLDDFIATAFSDNQAKKLELIEMLIAEGMTYSSKVKVVLALIKKHIPNEKDRAKRFPGLRNQLKNIADERNVFAHQILYLNLSREQMAAFDICLVNFKDLDNVVCYTTNDLVGIIERVQKYIDLLADIRREIWGQ